MSEDYDYVVVGSGAGGGPVAANLAKAGYRVLLLEAGGAPDCYDYQVPAFHTSACENDDMAWRFFVQHYEDPAQQGRDWKYVESERGAFYPRAGTLGGCTAHNAMITVYPSNSDWDSIANLTGDPSWRANKMRRYFQRLERCNYRGIQRALQCLLRWNPSRHGFKGWLETNVADPLLMLDDLALLEIITDSVEKAFAEEGQALEGFKRSLKGLFDPNDWKLVKDNSTGVRATPLTTRLGRRVGTRELILSTQRDFPNNLVVLTDALATRVLFDASKKAIGIEYLEGSHLYSADPNYQPGRPGALKQAKARGEIILAGGAFNTPQLLQLSGIGPAELLGKHGIPILADLPGVGANLQDRYEVTVVQRMKKRFALLEGATMRPPEPGETPDRHFLQWQQGKGMYTTNGAVLSIIKKSSPNKPVPDVFLFGLVTNFRGYYPGYSKDVQDSHQYFTWALLKGHTNNHAGQVQIRSTDPRERPAINFNYFNNLNDSDGSWKEDLDAVSNAVEFVRKISKGYEHLIEQEELPGEHCKTREDIRQFVKDAAWGHHASCTCKIGADGDPMAVLDSRFRVRGVKNLRVVDASVFPRVPGLFIVSAIYMIAEKASDVILEDAKLLN